MCRISSEKAYLKGEGNYSGMKLAQESILMQHGYTVSQTEGLSTARRQKILAVLIDNKILTKSDIISYLDFFISQKRVTTCTKRQLQNGRMTGSLLRNIRLAIIRNTM